MDAFNWGNSKRKPGAHQRATLKIYRTWTWSGWVACAICQWNWPTSQPAPTTAHQRGVFSCKPLCAWADLATSPKTRPRFRALIVRIIIKACVGCRYVSTQTAQCTVVLHAFVQRDRRCCCVSLSQRIQSTQNRAHATWPAVFVGRRAETSMALRTENALNTCH